MFALGEIYEPTDFDKAMFYKRACDINELKACEKVEHFVWKRNQQAKQEAIELEKAKAETATLEKEKLVLQIKAEELRRKEEEQALKQKIW